MTVTYSYEVADARLTGFLRLFGRWKGSVLKLLYKELIVYLMLFCAIMFTYRFMLPKCHQTNFEDLVTYCRSSLNLIPLSFILGFYVSIVVARWWEQFITIPWPDRLALILCSTLHGGDDRSRMMRRTIIRYVNLGFILVCVNMCKSVKKRFPTSEHIVAAGFMTEKERQIIDQVETIYPKYFIPFLWSTNIVTDARKEKKIAHDIYAIELVKEIDAYRSKVGDLFSYDWISIPLVYTQVVTIAVYCYFLTALIGRQFISTRATEKDHDDRNSIDLIIDPFLILEFIFYFGWLKVAETLINPFGEDEDDFDMHFIVDRNIQVGLLTVDNLYRQYPTLCKDLFWDDPNCYLPYTFASINKFKDPFMGSMADLNVAQSKQDFVNPDDRSKPQTQFGRLFNSPMRHSGRRFISTSRFSVNSNVDSAVSNGFTPSNSICSKLVDSVAQSKQDFVNPDDRSKPQTQFGRLFNSPMRHSGRRFISTSRFSVNSNVDSAVSNGFTPSNSICSKLVDRCLGEEIERTLSINNLLHPPETDDNDHESVIQDSTNDVFPHRALHRLSICEEEPGNDVEMAKDQSNC